MDFPHVTLNLNFPQPKIDSDTKFPYFSKSKETLAWTSKLLKYNCCKIPSHQHFFSQKIGIQNFLIDHNDCYKHTFSHEVFSLCTLYHSFFCFLCWGLQIFPSHIRPHLKKKIYCTVYSAFPFEIPCFSKVFVKVPASLGKFLEIGWVWMSSNIAILHLWLKLMCWIFLALL